MLNVTPVQLWCSQTPSPLSVLHRAAQSQPWRAAASPSSQAEQTWGVLSAREQGYIGGPQSCKGPAEAGHHPSKPCLGMSSSRLMSVWVQGSTVGLSWLVALALQMQ